MSYLVGISWRHQNEGRSQKQIESWDHKGYLSWKDQLFTLEIGKETVGLQHRCRAWSVAYSGHPINGCWTEDELIWNKAEGVFMGRHSARRFSRERWREKSPAHLLIRLSRKPLRQHVHGRWESGVSSFLLRAAATGAGAWTTAPQAVRMASKAAPRRAFSRTQVWVAQFVPCEQIQEIWGSDTCGSPSPWDHMSSSQ